ncbi:MAG: hypothetical protein IMF04_02110, partial [Proteobacteria bacterium]|nr:hypothetical protein [Pseudomonadota bacterium]
MRKFLVLFFSFVFSFVVTAAETQLLRIHGSNTVGANLAPELVLSWLLSKGYEVVLNKVTAKEERHISAIKQGDRLEVEIYAHGSSTSFKDFATGKTDVGMSSRRIKEKEIKKLSSLGALD